MLRYRVRMIIHLILSLLFGYSLAILLVEKGDDWPISLITKPLRFVLGKIHSKLPGVLECTVCASFWACLVGEIALKFWITGLFLWPFTGVIALGLTWTVIEFMNILDKPTLTDNDKTT